MQTIRVFISSPSDVAEERFVARGVAERLQGEFSGRLRLETLFWEHEPLLASKDFQTQIESPADYDIFVLILWARLGSPLAATFNRPDGSRYESGTEYEYESALETHAETGRPEILVYRKTATVTVALDDEAQLLEQLEQKRALGRFVEKWFVNEDRTAKSAYHTFARPEEFETIFEVHLRKLVEQHLGDRDAEAARADVVWAGQSPFRGLNAFEYEHAPVFFGRTRATAEILDALRHQAESGCAFVLVLGMSGCGKSSLARAGVVPMLMRPGVIKGVTRWARAVFAPSESSVEPIVGLTRALIQKDALPGLLDVATEAGIIELFRSHPENVRPLLERSMHHRGEKLVIVVDQLEEIFTHDFIDADERQAFVRVLSALGSTGHVWIIATMRSDFYPRCEELPELMALKEGRGQYDLAPPTPAEIAQMVRFPARAAGLRFEENAESGERLDDVLRDQASTNPEMLPLLEFTLEELYQRRTPEGLLTFTAYDAIGGVGGSIARRAEHVYGSLPASVQAEFDHTLDRLVTRSTSDRDAATRLRARLDELSQAGRELVDAFVDARLFVTELDEEEKRVGRIAHEALIKQWPRIQRWLADNEENLRFHARLTDAADRWRSEPSVDLLLPQGKPLEEAQLLEQRDFDLSPAERHFVRQSERRVRRNRRNRSAFLVVMALLTLGTAVGAGVALQQSQRARVEADTAQATTDFLVDLFQVSDPWSVSGAPGATVTAREILDRGAQDAVTELADQPRVQANFMQAIGNVYQGLGLVDQAEAMLQQAFETRRRLLGDDDPTVADSLQGLGFVEHAKGQYAQSEQYLREAVAIYRTAYGDESLPVFQALNLMSLTVANQDRLEEAIDIQTEAIGIMNLHDGVDFQDQSIAYNNLGYVLNAADRFPEAIDAFQQAVDLTEETAAIGLLARSLANLAAAHQGLGELGKARSLHEQSLALKREWFTEEHSEIGFSLNNLAAVVSLLGEYEYAVELYTDAIENFTGTLGADHPNIFTVQANLALSYENANDHEHAIELYLQSLEGTEASGGAGTSRTLRSHIGLGRSYRSLGIMDLALHHASEAVAVGMAVNPNGVRTGLALSGLASLDNSGLTDAARVEHFEQALSIVTIAVGSNHMDRATILLEFARFLDDTNRTERAQALFEEALVIKTRVLEPGHGDIAANQAEFEARFGK